MALISAVSLTVGATQTVVTDLGGPAAYPLSKNYAVSLTSGTAAGQADLIYQDTNTLAASATLDVDLAGALSGVFGSTLTFVRIKGLIVAAAAGNTNNVVVGAAAANQFVGPFGAATHTLAVRPGEFKVLVACGATDATGYLVTAGTGDLLRIANGGAGTSITYDLIVIGCSA